MAAAKDKTVGQRLAQFVQRSGPRNSAQLWWIGKIADVAATETRFDPTYLENILFSAPGTFVSLDGCGPDSAIDLLDEPRRALAS
ncbi:hypothetical protein ACWEDZ_34735 [Streptomyces sp. NPDC005047]